MAGPRERLPAKLSPPSAGGLVARPRLFDRLDAAANPRAVWIAAPAGAGKTSLVASWLAQRGGRAFWYQVDAGDADPVTVFHYLRLAARKAYPRRWQTLPALTPQMLPTPDAFAARFFERLFALCAGAQVLVFDGVHEVASPCAFDGLLAAAMAAVPEGALLVAISREPLPPALARWSTDERLAQIEWADLRLTDDEATAIARLEGLESPGQAASLNRQAKGWAAGLRLLLRAARHGIDIDAAPLEATQQVFDLLAHEVFATLPSVARELLVRTAFLPKVSAQAAQRLGGAADSAALLAGLHRRRLFVDRHDAKPEVRYEFHPLFRAFLRSLAEREFSAVALRELRQRTAQVLEEMGDCEAAATERLATQDWPALARLLFRLGPDLVAQGRLPALRAVTLQIPAAASEADPWLLIWQGLCLWPIDPLDSATRLERAYRALRARADRRGALAALACLVGNPVLGWIAGDATARWIAEFEVELAANDGQIPAPIEDIVFGAGQGLVMAEPSHPALPALVERARRRAESVADEAQRFANATLVASYLVWHGEVAEAARWTGRIVALGDRGQAPWPRTILAAWRTLALGVQGTDFDAARAVAREAITRAQADGAAQIVTLLYTQLAQVELMAEDADAVHAAIDAGWPLPSPWAAADVQGLRVLRCLAWLQQGRRADAESMLGTVLAQWTDAGQRCPMALMRTGLGGVLLQLGRLDEAEAQIDRALVLVWFGRMGKAWAARQRNPAQAQENLRVALAIGARHGLTYCQLTLSRSMLAELCSLALAAGIEPGHVQSLIRSRRLEPPAMSALPESWPWPVRVRTLGGFGIELDGAPLDLPARTPKRPLDLLKCLVALGGSGVAVSALIDALWPELDGDAAHNALKAALHRLRHILGDAATVHVSDGAVTLDRARVWVDALALAQSAEQAAGTWEPPNAGIADALPTGGGGAPVHPQVAIWLRLYRGPFLADEPARWAAAARQRLRRQFVAACLAEAERLERAGAAEAAIDLYSRVVDRDPLAESAYRGLMRCYRAAGRDAEAVAAYRDCERVLQALLGCPPSPATVALLRQVRPVA